jgi:hypothetical protein
MQIIFAIPTWNRAEQLEITVRGIANAIIASGLSSKIVISNNASSDHTQSILNILSCEFDFIEYSNMNTHVNGTVNFENVLSHAINISSENDYIWFFGDDDDLNSVMLPKVYETLINIQPYFASAGNTKLGPHTGKNYQAGMSDLVQIFGFATMCGFISQCIFSHEMAIEIVTNKLMSDKFKYDAYPHSCSTLLLGYNKKCIYLDYPISTFRTYPNQAKESRERYTSDNTYLYMFNFTDSIQYFIDENILPKKLERSFFRWWNFHHWDMMLYEATIMALHDKSTLNGEHWKKLQGLCEFIKDRELAKRLEINIELNRMLLTKNIEPDLILPLIRRYTFWGGAVYDNPVVTQDILAFSQVK